MMGFISDFIGSITGANSAADQADAARRAAEQQQAEMQKSINMTKNQMALQNQANLDPAKVIMGSDSREGVSPINGMAAKKRRQLITNSLGI
ncbi:hypothetical protein [Rickettsiella endosymbiont of Dermanyssus gallinae]|uniref:hypothetical protein n=1 Tax=Rickettsiella endosymbiont of Dermanyssus gallinae TaxID=2856608 RepID=UPI001C52CA72|nr:hypothetical protein [Rickettsiella endosymbiont of Dermanyssus gallinae]